MRTADAGAKDRILDAAARLFYGEGIRAVGLQRIIDECGCGKNLLYTHFPSKDALVAAYLERMRDAWGATLERELAPDSGDPAAQLIDVIRAAGRDVGTPGYRGCAFLNAAAEHPDADHPVHELCTAHVTGITAVVHELAASAGLHDPRAVTGRLMLVINGLRASGAALGTPAVTTAIGLAKDIIRSAAPQNSAAGLAQPLSPTRGPGAAGHAAGR
jgi:AcrR family transcriptional regulator